MCSLILFIWGGIDDKTIKDYILKYINVSGNIDDLFLSTMKKYNIGIVEALGAMKHAPSQTEPLLNLFWGNPKRTKFIPTPAEEIEKAVNYMSEKKLALSEERFEQLRENVIVNHLSLDYYKKVSDYEDPIILLNEAYQLGASQEIKNHIDKTITTDNINQFVKDWLNNIISLSDSCLKMLLSKTTVPFSTFPGHKLKYVVKFKLLTDAEIEGILNGTDQEYKKSLYKYCSNFNPIIMNYVKKNNLYNEVLVPLLPYTMKATGSIGPEKKIIHFINNPNKNNYSKTIAVARGNFSTFSATPYIKEKNDNEIKVGTIGIKETAKDREKRNLVLITGTLKNKWDQLSHVEKIVTIDKTGGSCFVKHYKGGDASQLLPVGEDDYSLKDRTTILLDACLGVSELKALGFLHFDFKLENIFHTRSKKTGQVKAVIGDLSGLYSKDSKHVILTYERPDDATEHGEEDICYSIWVAATLIYRGSDDPDVRRLLEKLRDEKTLDGIIKILEDYRASSME